MLSYSDFPKASGSTAEAAIGFLSEWGVEQKKLAFYLYLANISNCFVNFFNIYIHIMKLDFHEI